MVSKIVSIQPHPALTRQTIVCTGAPLVASDADKAGWQRDKFLVLKNMVPAAPVNALADEVFEAYGKYRDSVHPSLGGALSGHINFDTGVKGGAIAAMLSDLGLLPFMAELVSEPVAWSASGGNLNLPGSHAQHYHMDSNYHDEFLTVMVAMVPTTVENGAIEIIAESAQRRLRYAEFVARGMSRDGFRIPMDVGDVLIRSSCLWHRGMPNFTDRPRPVLTLSLHPVRRVAAGFDPFSVREVQFKSNFYSQGATGRLKEALVVNASWIYSGVRAAKSLFAPADAST